MEKTETKKQGSIAARYLAAVRQNPMGYRLFSVGLAFLLTAGTAAWLLISGASVALMLILSVAPLLFITASLLPMKPFYGSVFWVQRVLLFAGLCTGQAFLLQSFMDVLQETKLDAGEYGIWFFMWAGFAAAVGLLRWFTSGNSRRIAEGKRGGKFLRWERDTVLMFFPHSKVQRDESKKHTVLFGVFCGLLGLLAVFCVGGAIFLHNRFANMGFQALLFTIKNADDNGNPHLVLIIGAVIAGLILSGVFFCIYYTQKRGVRQLTARSLDKKEERVIPVFKGIPLMLWLFLTAAVLGGLYFAADSVSLFHYFKSMHDDSFYEEYYINPVNDLLTFPEKKKNLIYMYLESMENTFTSYDNGGNNSIDYIPELIEFEREGVNFSHTDGLGGLSVIYDNTSYTMGSTVAQTSGVPLFSPVGMTLKDDQTEMPGLRRMEDILHDAGYTQLFMIGSGGNFANYNKYVARYDDAVLYDKRDARKEGYTGDEDESFWGLSDTTVFKIARDKLTALAAQEKPFFLSLYTMDTHGPEGGFRCPLCDDEIENTYAAAVRCSSRQISEFVHWIQAQDFYKDTVIVMVGDHTAETVTRNAIIQDNGYVRNTYSCILNSDVVPVHEKNRLYAANDLFPTTLAAIGVKIDGERLGFGTNLFSDKPTLCEELGVSQYKDRITLITDYYYSHFWNLYD